MGAAHPRVPVSAVQALGMDRAAMPTMEGDLVASSDDTSIRAAQKSVWGGEREGKAIPWGDFSPASEKRGMVLTPFLPFLPGLGGKSPGKKINFFDGLFDPNIAFDSRYPQTPEREYALETRRAYAARNPLKGYELNPEDQRNSQAIPFLKPNPEFEA